MDKEHGQASIASILAHSRVNGPGDRSVVHFQGCSLGCGGCFNPQTHSFDGGEATDVVVLAQELAETAVDGVTISGGEPFQQPEALLGLVRALRALDIDSILIFSGFDYEEIVQQPSGAEILEHIDVLVAGRFEATQPSNGTILASTNQRAHFLSERHTVDELNLGGNLEITIAPDGVVHLTGFPPPDVRRLVRRLGDD